MVPNHQPVIVFWSCFFKYSDPSKVIIAAGKNHLWSPGEAAQRCHHFAPSGAAKVWRPQFLGPSGSFVDVLNRFQASYHPLLFYRWETIQEAKLISSYSEAQTTKGDQNSIHDMWGKVQFVSLFLIEASTYLPIWVWANTWNSAKHNCYSNSMAISGS